MLLHVSLFSSVLAGDTNNGYVRMILIYQVLRMNTTVVYECSPGHKLVERGGDERSMVTFIEPKSICFVGYNSSSSGASIVPVC